MKKRMAESNFLSVEIGEKSEFPFNVKIFKLCRFQTCQKYMLFTGLGRSVLGKTVPSVSSTAQGRRPLFLNSLFRR